jgi:hypothetical protein
VTGTAKKITDALQTRPLGYESWYFTKIYESWYFTKIMSVGKT